MNHIFKSRILRLAMTTIALVGLHAPLAFASLTDLATAPLATSTAQLVKPNIMYVLDDSGSMSYDYLPDWANSTNIALGRNSGYNGQYYNPSTTYTPPLKYDMSSYNAMSAGNTSNWTAVPFDGFGVQTVAMQSGTMLLTDSNSGTSQNLVNNAYYYTFIPGEYCSGRNLRDCVTQNAASVDYPYPAYLRWCTTSAMTVCQASRIETAPTNGSTYLIPRYPTKGGTSTITLTSASSATFSSITVDGLEILNQPTASTSTLSTLASNITTQINKCTSSIPSPTNCTRVTGYSASSARVGSTYVITITANQMVGPTPITPVITQNGAAYTGPTAFTGGVPGKILLTSIVSGTNSYVYPDTTAKSPTRTDCLAATCTYAEEMTNYANWWAYYRTRMQSTKAAASLAFSVLSSSFRLGYMSINNNTGSDMLNIGDFNSGIGGQRQLWYNKFIAAKPGNSTPLRGAISNAGKYYAAKLTKLNGVTTTDPMQYACQRNYTILSTDGYWNETATPTGLDGLEIGDTDSAESRPMLDDTGSSNTLADVTEYYYSTDLRSSTFSNMTNKSTSVDVSSNSVPDGQQRMYTSTVGLGASGYMLYQSDYATATSGDFFDVLSGTQASTTNAGDGICVWQTTGNCNWPIPKNNSMPNIDDLWHAAVNGRGNYYSAKSAVDLQAGLSAFLQTVTAATANSAGAAVSNINMVPGDNYLYQVSFRSVAWYGELARYGVDLTTGNATANATWSESGTATATTAPVTYTAPLLDQLAYTARTIFTFSPGNGANQTQAFDWASMSTAMKAYFQVAYVGSLSQFCTTGTSCLPSTAQVDSTTAGKTTGAGGINLVNFIRGDRSNEGRASTDYYFPRTHVLGDIINAQAVYIKAPNRNYADADYAAFKNTNLSRQGMVYVGANDGMLHAFNADTGAEAWAYIPSMVIPNLYKLADKNYGASHSSFVDATPVASDVYFDSAWHSVLVGGLGLGGRGFYALDVTTPSSPKVLWEFSSDTSKSGLTTDADLGYSFGTPIVTKLSDGTWVVIVSSGYNNVSPGSGHGIVWILNAKTGAVISKMDTNAGSSSAVTTGCSATPCPSGLTRLVPYIENESSNNLALRLYGGDLLGNLWRFDISGLTAGGGTPSIKLLATLTDPTGGRQPITTRPEVGFSQGSVLIFVGTGQYLGLSDVSTTQVQSIYGIKDATSTTSSVYGAPRASTCGATTVTSCFVQQTISTTDRTHASTVTYPLNLATMNGWYVDLPVSGERINVDPQLQLGTLAFVSNVPSSTNACSTGGSSYVLYFNYTTGLGVPNVLPLDGLILYGSTSSITSGFKLVTVNGSPKTIFSGAGGIGTGSGTTSATTPVNPFGSGTRRVSWRELVSGQ